jgi:hypothetical protein
LKKPQALIGLLAALGTALGVLVAVIGLPYGRADYTAFAELYHGTTDTTGQFHIASDCDITTAATDALCNVSQALASTSVDVGVGNSTGAGVMLGAFNWTLSTPDEVRLNAQAPACALPGLECNPDFLDDVESTEGLSGVGWSCGPPVPDDDNDGGTSGDQSFISCFNASDAPAFPAGPGHLDTGRVTYDLVGSPATLAGLVPLTLKDVNVFDETATELMSCNPVITTAGLCVDSAINIVEPPTATPTDTPTETPPATDTVPATDTPTATPTDTPIPPPEGSAILKDCDGDPNNTEDACNLWLCIPDVDSLCDGPGEGELRVVENAFNVFSDYDNDDVPDAVDPKVCTNFGPDLAPNTADDSQCIGVPGPNPANELGLGAYEFSVEYDNFVISSVNPCDIVFGPGGDGATRGDVDEVDSSSPENADCVQGAINGASTCEMSVILENVVHFGCVTEGDTPAGPSGLGPIALASLVLIPHEDLIDDLFPGNNNGVPTTIKDNGCELADVLGHPTLGDVNGGLTPVCGNLDVTVRILEGDINVDCDVDVSDAQAIAAHYGAFFGSLLYNKWLDLEPQFHDLDIDIKDVQKVFGRIGSDCQDPSPAQDPVPFP